MKPDAEDPIADDAFDFFRLTLRNPRKFLNTKTLVEGRRACEFVAQRFAHAPLFYFDRRLSAEAHKLSSQYPDVMMRLMQDVRLPFPNMIAVRWSLKDDDELVSDLLWEAGTKIRVQPYCAIRDEEVTGAALLPFAYVIHPDGRTMVSTEVEHFYGALLRRVVPKTNALPNSGLAIAHMLGSPDTIDLIRHFEMREPVGGLTKVMNRTLENEIVHSLSYSTGALLQTGALLVMLNMRDYVTRITEQPTRLGRYHYRGSSTPYMTSQVVTLRIPEPKVIRALKRRVSEIIMHHRRHSVRGHWAIRTKSPTCLHLFERLDEDHMRCGRCDALRFWRRAHERGDASLGFVRHDEYKVEYAAREFRA